MNKNVATVVIVIVVVLLCTLAVIYSPSIRVFMRGIIHGG